MRRDFVINILLIIAGIVLAFVLFGAGAMWGSRPARTSIKEMSQETRELTQGDTICRRKRALTRQNPAAKNTTKG
jgi:hypothetical protein